MVLCPKRIKLHRALATKIIAATGNPELFVGRSDITNLLYPIPWMKYLNASVSFAGCKHTEMLVYSVERLHIFKKFNWTTAGRLG